MTPGGHGPAEVHGRAGAPGDWISHLRGRRLTWTLFVLALVAGGAAWLLRGRTTASSHEAGGGAAPLLDAEVVRLADGQPVRLRDLAAGGGLGVVAWSPRCPCLRECDAKLAATMREFRLPGIRWVGLSAEPTYTLQLDRDRLFYEPPPYPVYRDPGGRLCRALDLPRATMVALIDASGQVRFRGTFRRGAVELASEPLVAAVRAMDIGSLPATVAFDSGVGCTFSWARDDKP